MIANPFCPEPTVGFLVILKCPDYRKSMSTNVQSRNRIDRAESAKKRSTSANVDIESITLDVITSDL